MNKNMRPSSGGGGVGMYKPSTRTSPVTTTILLILFWMSIQAIYKRKTVQACHFGHASVTLQIMEPKSKQSKNNVILDSR
jgi:hypothetical protein